MDQNEPIIHTFNSDIEAELKKKDASILGMATSNASHIEPTDPPDYKSIIIAIVAFTILITAGYFGWGYYKSVTYTDTRPNSLSINSTSTPATINNNSLATLMPLSYNHLYPYISLKESTGSYMVYKIDHYDGLIGAAINSETYMIADLKKYFKDNNKYDGFVDTSINNLDLRIANAVSTSSSSTSTFIYGMVNREYMIISTDTATWFNVYNKIVNP